jgi:hypothetical protein
VANRYTITDLTTLQGSTCCVDASTSPDNLPSPADEAGIGIFLVNTQVLPTQMVYIAARLNASTSVLMAEAAALALASTVTDRMNLQGINFLSDCAQLVQFLNMQDHTNPPDWRSKHFTQIFSNCTRDRDSKIYKIPRSLNVTADALARQALGQSRHQHQFSCSYEHQASLCTVLQALVSINISNVTVLSARCCC